MLQKRKLRLRDKKFSSKVALCVSGRGLTPWSGTAGLPGVPVTPKYPRSLAPEVSTLLPGPAHGGVSNCTGAGDRPRVHLVKISHAQLLLSGDKWGVGGVLGAQRRLLEGD